MSTQALPRQQRQYQSAYERAVDGVGFPDPKVADGVPLANSRILSLGGGNANDLWFLAPSNFIVNADYARTGLEAGRRNNVNGIVLDLNDHAALPFADQSFDTVICKDILEHLLDPLAIVREATRVLKDSGVLVLNVPNHFYWRMRLRLLLGKGIIWHDVFGGHQHDYDEWDYMHIRFFTYRGFRRFLCAAGLEPIRFYWDFGTLAHYHDPEMWMATQTEKRAAGWPLSRRATMALRYVRPLWTVFNTILPRKLRGAVVSLAPGLLCSGFYVRCAKQIRKDAPC